MSMLKLASVALLLAASSCPLPPIHPPSPSPGPTPTPVATPTPAPSPRPSVEPSLSPTPRATPAACPPLTRWGSTLFAARDANFNGIPGSAWQGSCTGSGDTRLQTCTVSGAAGITVDSTPHFEGGVRACNGSHPPEQEPCGGRICEDPRGGEWTFDGPGRCHVVDGYQLVCNNLAPGEVTWTVCPMEDPIDHEGKPVAVKGNACTSGIVILR